MKVKLITIISLILLVVSCSKKDDPVVEPDTVVNEDPVNETTNAVVLKGKFIDSEVQGLSYATATQSGITTANGEFEYIEGEEITFKIGDVILGKVLAQAEITPITFAQVTDVNATIASKLAQNIASFLQTLDTDGNESNGITISEEVASNLGVSGVDFSAPVEAVLAEIVLNVVQKVGVELDIIYPTEATNNMANSLGISFDAPENLSLTHLIPALKTYFQTFDKNYTSTSAVYKNTFDTQGNLIAMEIVSRYSGKIFFGLTFDSHTDNGLPKNGILTTYEANSLLGARPAYPERTNYITLTYNQDDQLSSLSFLDDSGIVYSKEQFTAFDADNRPLSFFRDLGVDNPNEDFTITWNFTYENGMIATADRIFDQVTIYDANDSYKNYSTRNFSYGYNEVGNLKSLNYSRIIESDYVYNGESSNSRMEAVISESFNYDEHKKITSYVINEDVNRSSGESYSGTTIRNYDANELIVSQEVSYSDGYEYSTSFEQGIRTSSVSYLNGLLVDEIEYLPNGGSISTSIRYDENGLVSYKEVYESNLDGLVQRIQEYYYNGDLSFIVIEDYSANILVKSTGYYSDESIAYVDYFNELGYLTRTDLYSDGEFDYYEESEFDANWVKIRTVSKSPDGEVISIRDFTYNSYGYLDSTTSSSPDGSVYFTEYYEYDESGYLSKQSGYGANGIVSYIWYFVEGNIVREEYYDENGELEDVYDYGASGKRVIDMGTSKNESLSQQARKRLSSSDVDKFEYKPKAKISDRNLKVKNIQVDIRRLKGYETIQKRRIGKR